MKYTCRDNKFVFNDTASSFVQVKEGATDRTVWFDQSRATQHGNTVAVEYSIKEKEVFAESEIQLFEGMDAVKQTNAVWGKGVLMQLSTLIFGVCEDENGIIDRLSDGSILIHYCINRWQCEGQWRVATPEELGIIAGTIHPGERSFWRIESLSSFSTATYYPLVIIEDKKKGQSWFFELEGGGSWFIEVYASKGLLAKSLSVNFGAFDERFACVKSLTQEKYYSKPCVYGVVDGGFEEAVKTLTAYKRKTNLVKTCMPLVFNDYMNCNWASESKEKLLPLIDAAAALGTEIFCIDDGWSIAQGIWQPNDEKFGVEGLKGIFDYITAKGMRVGVWFEFESLSWQAVERIGAKDCLLQRNGSVIDEMRPLANMRSKAVIEYLNTCVDYMYALGVRYIKNDHNNNELTGVSFDGESAGVGLEENEKAFIAFIDALTERYPDLMIENCGSGGMRSDHGTLRHFHLQSTSDQEFFDLYPSIIGGSLAFIPPEKAGVWCYPYPLSYEDRKKKELSREELQDFADGEQTVFNVVNGLMGCMYLSGKINQMDEYNFALLKEGVELYKAEREFIQGAYPIYPKGLVRISNKKEYALGLQRGERMLLAVWNLSSEERLVKVNLQKYGMKQCTLVYPHALKEEKYFFNGNELHYDFKKGKSARLFVLTK